MPDGLSFQADDPARAPVADLLARHHAMMRAGSPPDSCHVRTAEELVGGGAQVFSITDAGGAVVAVGGLSPVAPGHLELKSMHVAAGLRGTGIGAHLLARMIEAATRAGATRLSLETGSGPDHAAARAIYARAGFAPCPSFGSYRPDPLSVFMTKVL